MHLGACSKCRAVVRSLALVSKSLTEDAPSPAHCGSEADFGVGDDTHEIKCIFGRSFETEMDIPA